VVTKETPKRQYGIDELRAIKERVGPEILGLADVNGIGLGKRAGECYIRIGMIRENEATAEKIDGILVNVPHEPKVIGVPRMV
jgi:hypothetical protein